ncbi:MAG: hypothetical protein JWM41_3966 [Gemmatimonadetes bacterium]|nr:hypothetical protein [Gemmatimonadota bacterium]
MASRFVALSVITLVAVGCTHATPQSSVTPAHDLTRDQEIRQALNRLTFGPRPGDDTRVASVGVEKWIDMQLDPPSIPDTLAERVLATMETQRKQPFELIADHPDPQELQTRFNQISAAKGEKLVAFTAADSVLLRRAQQTTQQLTSQIQSATLVRAVASERQLQEVMTEFWENHFSVYLPKSPNRYSMVAYDRDVIRPLALGKFRTLLGAVAKSPQMLWYLDNYQSGVDSLHPNVDEQRIEARRQTMADDPLVQMLATLPRRRPRGVNENYARELMELHTLGVDGGYTQKDVQEVARALTGWTIEAPQLGGGFVFRPELHDAGEKVVLGHALAAGRGVADGEEVLDIVARAPATAHFIALKLARHFVSDDPPSALVDRCAGLFSKTDGDIRQTLRCVVTSPEFFSRAAYRAKVKSPFELVASSMRAFGAPPDTSPRAAQMVAQLGQPIYGHLTPEGWPDRGDAWMNSGAILNRINFGLRLAAGQIPSVRLATWTPGARLRQLPVAGQVDGVVHELLGGEVSPETRSILLSGENPVLSGTPPMKNAPPQLTGLASIVGLALGSPEFQRR